MVSTKSQYILGSSDLELERLGFQHGIWEPLTRELLARAHVSAGAHCLDVGCGPGFTTQLLRELVGASGSVVALDESPRWREVVEARIAAEAWSNVRFELGRIESAELPDAHFDRVFMRWVLSFVPEPTRALARLRETLKPGGLLVIQDYNHEGVSLFPESAGFRAVIRATRAWYAKSGGDTFVMGRLPGYLRAAGFKLIELEPRVLSGGPSSPAFRWAGAFFPHYSQKLVEEDLMTASERADFLRDWALRAQDPDALFFSPIVAGAIACIA